MAPHRAPKDPRLKRKLAAPLLALVVLLTIADGGAALAHANYADSDPKPNARLASSPSAITIDFSEPYVPEKSGVDLLAIDGTAIALTPATGKDATEMKLAVSSTLQNGTYAVAWHTVSAADGDAAHGYFAFAVGPPISVSAPPLERSAQQGEFALTFSATPGIAGENDFRVQVTTGGSAVANVTRVRLLVQPEARDLGIATHDLPAQADSFADHGMDLALAGKYKITVQVRRRDILDDLVFPLELDVPGTAAVASPTPSASPSPSSSPTPTRTEAPGGLSAPLAVGVAGILAVVAVGAFALTRERR